MRQTTAGQGKQTGSTSAHNSAKTTLRDVRRRQQWTWHQKATLVFFVVAAIAFWLLWGVWQDRQARQEKEVERLIGEASAIILHQADYVKAEELAARALTMTSAPGHVEFYASIVLGLGRIDEALEYYRSLFTSAGDSLLVLQRYLLILHRKGLVEERERVWKAIESRVPWTSPWQCPDHVDETLLPGRPIHKASEYRATRKLEENLPLVVKELDAYLKQPSQGFIPNQDIDLVDGYKREAWNELLLFDRGRWKEDLCDPGRPFHGTCQILRGLKEVEGRYRNYRSGQVSFLKLMPGTHLVPHFGTVNWRLVASCGIRVPPGITMKVGGQETFWEEGKCTVFDDSFLHEVWHNGTEPRYVLFANFFIVTPE